MLLMSQARKKRRHDQEVTYRRRLLLHYLLSRLARMATDGDPALDSLPDLFAFCELKPDLRTADRNLKDGFPMVPLYAAERVLTGLPYTYDDEVTKA